MATFRSLASWAFKQRVTSAQIEQGPKGLNLCATGPTNDIDGVGNDEVGILAVSGVNGLTTARAVIVEADFQGWNDDGSSSAALRLYVNGNLVHARRYILGAANQQGAIGPLRKKVTVGAGLLTVEARVFRIGGGNITVTSGSPGTLTAIDHGTDF